MLCSLYNTNFQGEIVRKVHRLYLQGGVLHITTRLSVEWGKSLGRALVVFRQHAHGPNNRSASAPHPIT
jgi:hypothetical protein